ncbi:MAG TPA: TonB-dependent receptor [Woeseiaceae bacterium]|nr:TonB-dependent receptor [Woeseiaceae bacterium]
MAALVALPATSVFADAPPVVAAADVFEMSIEELGKLRVTSVSRRSEPWYRASSAIYVITAEDIRRSGLTRLPEILRLAPGVEVARNGTHSWTISIRGFNSDLSNKLLVLIDGRSVYSPLFAGVFWDAQNVPVQDIERIEVISGPGGTLWGANAVNGVINIITRPAAETQGTLVDVGAGNEHRGFLAVRHGWQPAEDIAARAYLEYSDSDASASMTGEDAFDDAHRIQAGFRMDWERTGRDRLTLQGDAYDAELGSLLRPEFTLGTLPGPDEPGTVDIGGFNVLGRWDRDLDGGGRLQLQAYIDHTSREIPGTFDEKRDTLDLDFQHDFAPGERHRIIWGGGFRVTSDELDNTTFASFLPEERTDETFSLFAQDDIELWSEDVLLTVGAKVEHNDYTDWEFQPNLRLSWTPSDRHFLWAAVSRAVRIPARLNTDLELFAPVAVPGLPVPLYINVSGSKDFAAEELVATELGYRLGYGEDLSFDLALFHHDYENLQTQEASPIVAVGDPPRYLLLPATLGNNMQGRSSGGTLVANWQPTASWRLQFQYAYLNMDLETEADSNDAGAVNVAGNSPEHQAAVHSYLQLPQDFDLFMSVRYVDELPNQNVPDRTAVDLSLGWEPLDELRLSLTVRNLNDDEHLEFGGGNLIERSAWARAVWTF